MRWILPLLSLALVAPASAEIAVYTGTLAVQNLTDRSASSIVRIADIIDLDSGKIVTIGLSGTRTAYSYAIGPEVQYVVAKAKGLTAFAQASSDTDSAGAKFANAATLRGRDVNVTLSDAGPSQWPRTLVGSGSLVSSAGTDPAIAPASISTSAILLTLNLPYSKTANEVGGTLLEVAQIIGQQYRNRTAAALHFTPVNLAVISSTLPTTGGLIKTGPGTLVFGDISNNFANAISVSGGTLRLTGANTYTGTTTVSGGTLQLNNPTQTYTGTTTINGGAILQLTNYAPIGGSITFAGNNAGSGPIVSGVVAVRSNPIDLMLSNTTLLGQTVTPPPQLNINTPIVLAPPASGSFLGAGTVTLNTITVNPTLTFGSTLTNITPSMLTEGALIKTGSGTLIYHTNGTFTNTQTGATGTLTTVIGSTSVVGTDTP